MRIMLVSASLAGFREPVWNDNKTHGLMEIVAGGPADLRVVVAPAGYWSIDDEEELTPFLGELAAQLAGTLEGCVLFGGVDLLPRPADEDVAVEMGQYPSFGFAIDPDGHLLGPWRQVSTTPHNADAAPAGLPEQILGRTVWVQQRVHTLPVLHLVCGEMFSGRVRDCVGDWVVENEPLLVVASFHSSVGQGLVPSMQSMHHLSHRPVVMTHHLVPHPHGSVHWIDIHGYPHHAQVNTAGPDYHIPGGFWISGHHVNLQT